MCEPITWTALALTAAGTYEQYQGSKQATNAMSAAAELESRRQKGFNEQSDTLFQQSLARSSQPKQQELLGSAMENRLAQTAAAQKAAPVASTPAQGGTPKIVSDETKARVTQGNVSAGQNAALRAAMSAYGDQNLGNALANARFSRSQATLGNFMQGSQGVLASEIEGASHAGDKKKMVGQGLSTLGQLVGMYGAMMPATPKPIPMTPTPGGWLPDIPFNPGKW
jgi:hypothetical protein